MNDRPLSASGLDEAALGLLRETLAAAPMLRSAWLFGSRAKGTARSNSDIDIAVEGLAQSLAVESLRDRLNELPLPYAVEVQPLENIKNIELREHISRCGVLLFNREA
ncbi:MAG: nucleotidyltransferase domain-containing protein [Desulfobulbus sp.]|jgi:predicted nucleotidyltransferase|uniref:nucleotidyltransferase domain-containing protein n=1 Tax=Desulfobulbus sp. TaxID=895 RepID=UPI00283D4897|nr:nucleotidyltransferase domain-containing protein [Desulfobulbus sp.]MDR2549042.1 nucleotidyltransferase domain-containing protein [Desulfobulbus sp.]